MGSEGTDGGLRDVARVPSPQGIARHDLLRIEPDPYVAAEIRDERAYGLIDRRPIVVADRPCAVDFDWEQRAVSGDVEHCQPIEREHDSARREPGLQHLFTDRWVGSAAAVVA